MLTLLGLLNQYLGFFNVNTKFKGRLYTVLGFGGSWYILYIAISFITAQRYLRGVALLAAFIGLMYVIYLNFVYYFTDKQARFDISPAFEKMIGTNHASEATGEAQNIVVPNNGIYREQQVLPTAIKSNRDEVHNIELVAKQLISLNLYAQDYQKMSDHALRKQLTLNNNQPIFANYPGTVMPFAKLVTQGNHLVIYGGINEIEALRLGEITRVGLADVATALKNSDIFLATIMLSGGRGKTLTRSSFNEADYPYAIQVEVAYKLK